MKKLLALLLALCLLCAFALAEEDEDSGPLELNWEDVVREDIEAAGTAEQITVAGVTLLYWIPGDMAPADVSGSRAENPPAAVYATEDGEYAISLYILEVSGLEEYLSGDERRGDLAADEAGLLPPSLRRGVLSEDGIYGLLEENGELRGRMKTLF